MMPPGSPDQRQCDDAACAGQSRADRHDRSETGDKGLVHGVANQLFRWRIEILRDSNGS